MRSPFDPTPDQGADQAGDSAESLAISLQDLAKSSKETRMEVTLSSRDLELMHRNLTRNRQEMDRLAATYWKNPQTHPAFAPGAGSQQARPLPGQIQAEAEYRRLTDAVNHLTRVIESQGTGGSTTAQTAVTALGLASVQQAVSGQTAALQGMGQGRPAQQQPPTPPQQPSLPTGAVSQTLTPYLRQLDMARAGQMEREDLRGSLEELPGYRLKELRDHIGAEPGGRSNAEIVERILGTVPSYQREEQEQASPPAQQQKPQPTTQQPSAPPAQQTTPTPTATQASPPVESTAPTPTQPQPPEQPTPPSSVHAPFSLAAMRSQWQGNPPPTEEEIEKRMESMGLPELRKLRDEMQGEPRGRSKEELRERIRAAHRRQQQEYQAFLASQASAPPTTSTPPTAVAVIEPVQATESQAVQTPAVQTPATEPPSRAARARATPREDIAARIQAAREREAHIYEYFYPRRTPTEEPAPTASAAPPAPPPGIPPGAPPSAPEPSGESDPQKNRPTRRTRPQTPAAPDLWLLEKRMAAANDDQLRGMRDDLGAKGGRSSADVRTIIRGRAEDLHRQEYAAQQNNAYDRARSQYMYQRLILPEVTGGPHQRVAGMQAQLMGASSVYMAREQEVQQRAMSSYLATSEGANNLTQAAQAQAQGGQIGNLNTLKQQVELEQQKLKYMRTPEGRQALKEEARLQRELLYIQKQAPWEKMVAEQGKFGAGVTTAHQKLGELQRKLSGVGQSAGNIWALGTTGIMGLVAMADPFSTFPTLQESVKGLAIELGQGFLPIVDSVSQRLQNMTHWLEGFDSATKKNVASSAAWVIAGAGIVYAAAKIGSAVYGAVGALRTFQLALVATPVSATLGGFAAITTAAVGLAAAYSLLGNNARDAGNGMASAADKAELKRREDEKRSVYEALPDGFKKKYREAKDEEGRREVLREHQKKAKEDLEKAKAAELADVSVSDREILMHEIDKEISNRDLARKNLRLGGGSAARLGDVPAKRKDLEDTTVNEITRKMEEKKLINPQNKKEVREVIREKTWASMQGKDHREKDAFDARRWSVAQEKNRDKIAELQAQYHSATRLLDRTGTEGEGMQRAFRNMPAPQITDPMSYADKIQIQALKGDDLTNQNLAKQLQSLDKLGVLMTGVKQELNILNGKVSRPYRSGMGDY